jgi:DNA-nicking Smr family endonuclease
LVSLWFTFVHFCSLLFTFDGFPIHRHRERGVLELDLHGLHASEALHSLLFTFDGFPIHRHRERGVLELDLHGLHASEALNVLWARVQGEH